MNAISAISRQLMIFIRKMLPDKSEIEYDEINYGLQVFVNSMLELPIIFLIAFITGILKYTFIAFLSFTFVRAFSSGIHAKKPLSCFLSTSIIFLGPAYISRYFSLNTLYISFFFIICMFLVIIYAPADTENRPLISKKLRKRLKLISCFSILMMYLISILLSDTAYSCIITFSVLIECITITPIVYKILGRRYNNYETYSS